MRPAVCLAVNMYITLVFTICQQLFESFYESAVPLGRVGSESGSIVLLLIYMCTYVVRACVMWARVRRACVTRVLRAMRV